MPRDSSAIRWAILGTGYVAAEFARGLAQVQSASLRGIAGRTLAKVKEFASCYRCIAYDTYDDLLSDPLVDIVYIATPPHRHMADCLKALSHGKAIVCEKPFALSRDQAQVVIDMARVRGLFCMEAMWMRFMPLLTQVKGILAAGEIGHPLHVTGDFSYLVKSDLRCHLFHPHKGGGALLDRGVYLVSLSHALFGTPLSMSSQAQIGPSGVDEHCFLTLQYPGGLVAHLSASMRVRGSNVFHIIGDRGAIKIHAPFYKPHCVSITRYPSGLASGRKSPDFTRYACALRTMVELPKVAPFVEGLRWIAERLREQRCTEKLRHYPGNGYQFEAAAATQCMLHAKNESPIMTHQATLEVMGILDAARRGWA